MSGLILAQRLQNMPRPVHDTAEAVGKLADAVAAFPEAIRSGVAIICFTIIIVTVVNILARVVYGNPRRPN